MYIGTVTSCSGPWMSPPSCCSFRASSAGVPAASADTVPPDRGDRLETRMDAERPQQVPDVVAYRLRAQVQLARDLVRRGAALEQAEDLDLARRQVRRRRLRRLL